MADSNPMSPDASPVKVNTQSGVRRVNNMPLYLVLSALGVFLVVMVLVAIDRSEKNQKTVKVAEKGGGDSSRSAKDIIGDRRDGVVKAKPVAPPDSPSGTGFAPGQPSDTLPPPPPSELGMPAERDENAERIHQAKLARLEEAVRSKSRVQVENSRGSGSLTSLPSSPPTREDALLRITAAQQQAASVSTSDPTSAYRARVAQLQAVGVGAPSGGALGQSLQSGSGRGSDYTQFGAGGGDRWRLDSEVQPPRSPYELRAGFVIPATLISGINSDLPGQIIGQVSQDVYDTATGKFKLIPQGARLVGAYSSSVAYGQSRVLVAWQRVIFPDGKALDIGSMPGADGAGYAGFKDEVNNHYLRVFGSALLMSGVVAGVTYSQGRNSTTGTAYAPTASSALSEALGQQLGQATAQMISKNMNIAPTLEIRPGFRFNVIVVKDLTFSKPYASFDY
jgi:type IV secretory pathway VirB10-like protein